MKSKGTALDSDDDEAKSEDEDLDRRERTSSRRSGKKYVMGGEVLDRLNNAGKLLWSQDKDKYKNEPKYARTKSDSDDEGDKHLHWRKNWHPDVKHHIHGGRGVQKRSCDKDRKNVDSDDEKAQSSSDEERVSKRRRSPRRKTANDDSKSESEGSASDDSGEENEKRARKQEKKQNGENSSSDDSESDESEDENRPQSTAQKLKKINKQVKHIDKNLSEALNPEK